MDKISWDDRVKDEEMLHRIKEERNIVHNNKKEGRPTGLATHCVGTAF
jgi:hypothetical protein